MRAVAELLQTNPKTVYRRLEEIRRALRKALLTAGVSGPAAIGR